MTSLINYGASEKLYQIVSESGKGSLGRVISQSKRLYRVVTDKGECNGEVTGKIRHAATSTADYPAVGDFVLITVSQSTGKGVIRQILPRYTVFERTVVGKQSQRQVVASNIDVVFLCMSLNNNYNLRRLERYLSVAWQSGAQPVVVLTKRDLCENVTEILTDVQNVAGKAPVILTSSDVPEETAALLRAHLRPQQTAAFIGSSGVGKSTLVNILAGKNIQQTQEIRETDDKGRHTTSRREMIALPSGELVIDTPGMREFGVDTIDLETSFADIEELALSCKFSDCRHITEPGCAVRAAVEDGTLDPMRLENYLKLRDEAAAIG